MSKISRGAGSQRKRPASAKSFKGRSASGSARSDTPSSEAAPLAQAASAHRLEPQAFRERWHSFWFERSIEQNRLALFRLLFFGMLGFDQLYLMVEKAYRYGAGGFNVAQVPLLDDLLPLPQPAVHSALYLLGGFLALRVALGIAVRVSLLGLTLTYGYTYFSSLHDAYQHHYLIFWILIISFALPLEQTGGIDRPLSARGSAALEPAGDTARGMRRQSWGVALLYCQIAIVYLFTAVSKASEYWLNGWALQRQISTPWIREGMQGLEQALGLGDATSYALLARVVFAWELVAALAFLVPKLRTFACISGPFFHAAVELIGLEVRWFSYYMLVTYYVLLIPDAWFQKLTQAIGSLFDGPAKLWRRWLETPEPSEGMRRLGTGAAVVASALLCAAIPLPGAKAVALAVGSLVLLSEYAPHQARSRAAAVAEQHADFGKLAARLLSQVALAALVAGVPRYTDTAYNYYRFEAGDLSRRGETEAAIASYRRAIELNPGPSSRHEKLARLLLSLGRAGEALPVYQEAYRLRPNDAGVIDGLAKTLEALGRGGEAREMRLRLSGKSVATPKANGDPPAADDSE